MDDQKEKYSIHSKLPFNSFVKNNIIVNQKNNF